MLSKRRIALQRSRRGQQRKKDGGNTSPEGPERQERQKDTKKEKE